MFILKVTATLCTELLYSNVSILAAVEHIVTNYYNTINVLSFVLAPLVEHCHKMFTFFKRSYAYYVDILNS